MTTSGSVTAVAISAARRTRGRSGDSSSEVDDGQVSVRVMPADRLHVGHDQLAQLVDGLGLGADDDVVGTGDVLGAGDAGEAAISAATAAALPTSVWIRM